MKIEEAKKYFWTKTFKDTFPNMNDYSVVIKMSYSGGEIDKFIEKIYDKFENRTCTNCKHLYIPKVEGFNPSCKIGVCQNSNNHSINLSF